MIRPRSLRRFWSLLLPDWADRNLKIVLAARVGMSVGRAVAAVVTSLYLAAIGFDAIEIGVLFVVVTVASALMSTAIGLLADRVGRKPFLVAIPLLAALAAIAYAYDRSTLVLFAGAAVGSFGRGAGAGGGSVGPYRPAESAIVAEAAGGAHRAAAFSRIAFASSLGALLGGLAAELVRTTPHMTPEAATVAFRPAFLLAAALAIFAGLVALGIREPRRTVTSGAHRAWLRWPKRSWPVLWRFWVTNAVNGAGIGMFGPFVSYWLFRRYGATPGTIGVLFAVVNLGSLVSVLSAAIVERRFGTVKAIVAARVIGGSLIVPMVLMPSFLAAGAIYLVRMLVQRIGQPLRQSFTQDLADPGERASLAALSTLPMQGTMSGGQAAAGWLFDEVGLSAPFLASAAFQILNAAAYWLLFARHPPRSVERLVRVCPNDSRDQRARDPLAEAHEIAERASAPTTNQSGGSGL